MAQKSCNLDKDEAEILKPTSSSSSSSPSQPPPLSSSPPPPPSMFIKPSQKPCERTETPAADDEESRQPIRFGNRCLSCRKRVGLTGFRCRCGDLFCPRHRYSDTHDCSFDYKAAGREEISKANPVIRAAKLIKI